MTEEATTAGPTQPRVEPKANRNEYGHQREDDDDDDGKEEKRARPLHRHMLHAPWPPFCGPRPGSLLIRRTGLDVCTEFYRVFRRVGSAVLGVWNGPTRCYRVLPSFFCRPIGSYWVLPSFFFISSAVTIWVLLFVLLAVTGFLPSFSFRSKFRRVCLRGPVSRYFFFT